eukprot:scaffold45087_cov68-Phaeocystis_antarctica.AAC.2
MNHSASRYRRRYAANTFFGATAATRPTQPSAAPPPPPPASRSPRAHREILHRALRLPPPVRDQHYFWSRCRYAANTVLGVSVTASRNTLSRVNCEATRTQCAPRSAPPSPLRGQKSAPRQRSAPTPPAAPRATAAITALRATALRRAPRSARAHLENSAPRHRRCYAAKTALRATAVRRPPPAAPRARTAKPAPRATAAATRPKQRLAPPPPTAHRRRYAARTALRATTAKDLDHHAPHPVTGLHCCRGAGVGAARGARHDWPALTRGPSTAHGALAHRAGRAHTAREAGPTALALGAVTVLLGLESDTDAQMSHAQRLLARSALLRAAAASGCRR